MSYYSEIYLKRLNKYGTTFQERLQGERESEFERRLSKSVYQVNFTYNNTTQVATLEKYKQDDTQTLQYLLTRRNLSIPPGTIIEINSTGAMNETMWMVYWQENIEASGYNKYIVLKMSHYLTWKDRNGNIQNSWAYLYGQEDNMLKDELKSRSRMNTLYTENLKLSFFILPVNANINRDDYLEVGENELKEAYRVTGYDRQSTKGVEYVSIDPVYIYDTTPYPQNTNNSTANEWKWVDLKS